ncbi:MAG: response regulator transcription factor [Bacteroidales bacterium]|nr:response regulator transcription factor [Bacteroidales bacterium]
MEQQITIYLIDDHKIVRDGVKSLLMGEKNIVVTGESDTGSGLLNLMKKGIPDIIVLDLALPDISGVALTKSVSTLYPDAKIIILTAEMDENIIVETIKNGACGFLNKDVSGKEFIDALKLVSEGECYFGQRVSGIIYKSYINKIQKPGADTSGLQRISAREREIITLLSEGLSFKEVGEKLCISPRTVENHKTNILEKLGLKNTIELVKFAIKQGIIRI